MILIPHRVTEPKFSDYSSFYPFPSSPFLTGIYTFPNRYTTSSWCNNTTSSRCNKFRSNADTANSIGDRAANNSCSGINDDDGDDYNNFYC